MNDQKSLHLRRLQESLQATDDFLEQKVTGKIPTFELGRSE